VEFLCHCPLCRFEIETASIVDPAAKLAKRLAKRNSDAPKWIESEKAGRELEDARRYLFKQFNVPIPEYESGKVPIFDTKSPGQFSFAKLLVPILCMLQSALRQRRAYAGVIPYITEIHALIKDNLHFSAVDPLTCPNYATTVWSHHHRTSHPKVATLWLEGLKCICSLVGGNKFYKGNFHASVQDEIVRYPCKEKTDA
jgi:hypothetical protein